MASLFLLTCPRKPTGMPMFLEDDGIYYSNDGQSKNQSASATHQTDIAFIKRLLSPKGCALIEEDMPGIVVIEV